MRSSPIYSSQSQGTVERFHSTLYSQVRALRMHASDKYKLTTIPHTLFPWLLRHANWLLNRYLIHSDGLTSYQRRWGRPYISPLCPFAECIYFHHSGKHFSKLDSSWARGIYLGRDTEADEVLVGTSIGVFRTRSTRRDTPERQWFRASDATSWRTMGTQRRTSFTASCCATS